MPSNPTYRKVNPSDAPILILALTSDTVDKPQMYDAASSILAQKLSQVKGVGQVIVGGSSLPGVRVERLSRYGGRMTSPERLSILGLEFTFIPWRLPGPREESCK